MQDQLTLQVGRPTVRASGPIREWTGRDAVALRKALRMTEAKFARAVGVSPRTVANWHTKPETVPLNNAQDMLDELLNDADASVVERFERFARLQALPGQPALCAVPAHAVPGDQASERVRRLPGRGATDPEWDEFLAWRAARRAQ